jgi:anti-sigma regulatory factor (Ser/Thr protein kinase)
MPEASESDGSNRGLLLMRGLMDSVDVVSGPEGTNVLMRRRVGEAAQRG